MDPGSFHAGGRSRIHGGPGGWARFDDGVRRSGRPDGVSMRIKLSGVRGHRCARVARWTVPAPMRARSFRWARGWRRGRLRAGHGAKAAVKHDGADFRRPPALASPRAEHVPPPVSPRPLPARYLSRAGSHAPHPGAGLGPRPRRRMTRRRSSDRHARSPGPDRRRHDSPGVPGVSRARIDHCSGPRWSFTQVSACAPPALLDGARLDPVPGLAPESVQPVGPVSVPGQRSVRATPKFRCWR